MDSGICILLMFVICSSVQCMYNGGNSHSGGSNPDPVPDPCHGVDCHHGHCVNGHCSCYTGYQGKYCTEFDPCRSFNCGGYGTCTMTTAHVGVSQIALPQCSCSNGYYGSHCEYYDPCYNYACYTGTCQIQANTGIAFCTCPAGYSGDHCENFDPCYSYACNTGTCHANTDVPYCTCPAGYSGYHCEIVQTTTTTPTTTTTTTMNLVPTIAPIHYTCTTAQSINDLATNVKSNNPNASSCALSDHAGSDAFVLNHCDVVKQPAAWSPGQNVMDFCHSIPIYTPVATFTNNQTFNSASDTAAIFLGCLGTDIRIGLQTCDAGTRIEHFKVGGPDYRDAKLYFVIQ